MGCHPAGRALSIAEQACASFLHLQGRHTDRLLTATYLPANLAVLAALTAAHGAVRPKLRIVAGLAGFSLALSAVTQVNT